MLSEAESSQGTAGAGVHANSFHVTVICVLGHPVLFLRGRHGVYVLPLSPILPD